MSTDPLRSAVAQRTRGARSHRAWRRQAPPGQFAFGFLPELPRVERRAQWAFRPHLRGRTQLAGEQFVLPLRSPRGARRYVGVEAIAVEDALRAARAGSPGAVEQILALTRPEVAEVARAVWNPRCGLEVEELQAVGEARLVELQAWQRFEPGRAPGRTLWPAFARRLARQAMATALEGEGSPVHVTRWARRRRAALEARAEAEGRTLEEVVEASPEGGAAAALLLEPVAAPLEAAAHLPAETQEERTQEALAVVHLARLPVRERVAVAGPLGLLKEGPLSDVRLARHLKCTVAEVLELRELGLERLRVVMGA